jgi:hypothetical protein
VTTVGGGQHIAAWTASMPGRADEVFRMLENRDLPALPDCGRLRAFHTAAVYGCP